MKAAIPNGKYVLAVSGGVDSMSLLHLLSQRPGLELVVAHFNHGIRTDAVEDERLVEAAAKKHGLVFEIGRVNLGPGASEALARQARYKFLNGALVKYAAAKIITAHHQDDLMETALLNLARGTGLHGLSPMSNSQTILRPLLSTPKQTILSYALKNKLIWNEDQTNLNENYSRNYLRIKYLSRLTKEERSKLLKNLEKVANINNKLNIEFATLSQYNVIERQSFTDLPYGVGTEYVAHILRELGIRDYDAKLVKRLSMAIKTAKPNSAQPVKNHTRLIITGRDATFVTP